TDSVVSVEYGILTEMFWICSQPQSAGRPFHEPAVEIRARNLPRLAARPACQADAGGAALAVRLHAQPRKRCVRRRLRPGPGDMGTDDRPRRLGEILPHDGVGEDTDAART